MSIYAELHVDLSYATRSILEACLVLLLVLPHVRSVVYMLIKDRVNILNSQSFA